MRPLILVPGHAADGWGPGLISAGWAADAGGALLLSHPSSLREETLEFATGDCDLDIISLADREALPTDVFVSFGEANGC